MSSKRTSYYSLDLEYLPKAHVLNVWTIVHGAIRRWWNFKEVKPSGASNHWGDLLKGTMKLQTLPLFFTSQPQEEQFFYAMHTLPQAQKQ